VDQTKRAKWLFLIKLVNWPKLLKWSDFANRLFRMSTILSEKNIYTSRRDGSEGIVCYSNSSGVNEACEQ